MGLRQNKIADQIFNTLSEILYKEVRDPRLKDVYITAVKISPDLQISKVYFMFKSFSTSFCLDDSMPQTLSKRLSNSDSNDDFEEKKLRALDGLNSCQGFFRKHLNSVLYIKRLPELKFYYDHSNDRAGKISKIIDNL